MTEHTVQIIVEAHSDLAYAAGIRENMKRNDAGEFGMDSDVTR